MFDLKAAALALLAIPTAKWMVWVFNVEVTLDLLMAIALATINDAAPPLMPIGSRRFGFLACW